MFATSAQLLPDIDRTGNCLTNTSVFLNWGGGDVCNGHGECVAGYCVCDEAWTGRSDMFTLNGYACAIPIALEKFIWYLVATGFIYAFFKGLQITFREVGKTGSMHRWKLFYTGCIAFVFAPLMIALGFTRAYLGQNIGVDLAPTVLTVLAFGFQQVVGMVDHYLFINFLVKSNIDNAQIKDQLLRRVHYQGFIGTSLAIVTMIFSWVPGLFIPQGPTTVRLGLMYLKFISTLIFFLKTFLINNVLLRELNKIKQVLDSGRADAVMNEKDMTHARLLAVIKHMKGKVNETSHSVLVSTCTIGLFLVCPPLVAFEFVPAGLLYAMAGFVSISQYEAVRMGTKSSGDTGNNSSKAEIGAFPQLLAPARASKDSEQQMATTGQGESKVTSTQE